MKLWVLVVVSLAIVGIGSSREPRESSARIGPSLQAAMDKSLAGSGAVGVSAAVLLPDGTMWTGATGMSHEGAPMTTDMLFDIASVQKNLQAALALKLVDEGVIVLDDPVEKWLGPIPNIDRAITIRQLLNMTSGIHDFVGDPASPFRVGYVNVDFEKVWTWEEIQRVFIREPSFAPGTECEYSSTNYIVLRQIIEKASHEKQPALLGEEILKPNHLNHTLADLSKPIPNSMRVAHGWFDVNDDGAPEDISGNSINWAASLAPMLVYSTPSDMARWLDALFHRKTVLKEETLKQMLTFGGPVRGEPLMKGYGLGVVDINLGLMYPQWQHVRVYGHLGNQYGYMTFAGYFPDYGVSVVVMSNRGCDQGSQQAIGTVGGAVLDTLLTRLATKQ